MTKVSRGGVFDPVPDPRISLTVHIRKIHVALYAYANLKIFFFALWCFLLFSFFSLEIPVPSLLPEATECLKVHVISVSLF